PSEYGQVTYSTPMDQYGSLSFGPEMLSVGGEHTTLGDLWAHPSSTDPINPTVYIPIKEGELMELVAIDDDNFSLGTDLDRSS
ncbi:hypothetical protein HOG48_02930, partial [Candidatus Peregrinibacteria bacterium]|nr:hypothetical protein [Candidatus Peregrinibacteria bacterium]